MLINMMITSEKGNEPVEPIRVNSWINDVNLTYPNVPKVSASVLFSS